MKYQFRKSVRPESDVKVGRIARTVRAADFVLRLQAMQKLLNAKSFAVLRLSGGSLPSARRLTCVLSNWGPAVEENTRILIDAYGQSLMEHLETSLLPVLWNGSGEHQAAEAPEFARFVTRFKARLVPYSAVAFPVRLGALGNGYVIFMGSYIDLGNDLLVDLHGKSCQIMVDMLANDEKKTQPAENLSEREIGCLQMAGDGCISEEIAEKMGLSVHTVNAYLGTATTKLDAVNRIQAIAKAIRLGYIS